MGMDVLRVVMETRDAGMCKNTTERPFFVWNGIAGQQRSWNFIRMVKTNSAQAHVVISSAAAEILLSAQGLHVPARCIPALRCARCQIPSPSGESDEEWLWFFQQASQTYWTPHGNSPVVTESICFFEDDDAYYFQDVEPASLDDDF